MDKAVNPGNAPELSVRRRFDNVWSRFTSRADIDFTDGTGAIISGIIDHGEGVVEGVIIRVLDEPYVPGTLNSPHFKPPKRTIELMRIDEDTIMLNDPIVATWSDEESVIETLTILESVTTE